MHRTAVRVMLPLAASLLVLSLAAQTPIVSKKGNHYLRPDDFPHVPAHVRAQLNQRHCLIPQDVETKHRHNIVSGHFARPGQTDWEAECSRKSKSQVVMIWGGPSRCSGEVFGDPIPDDFMLIAPDPEQWGRMPPRRAFSVLSVLPQRKVIAHQEIGIAIEPMLRSADHDALGESQIGNGNTVYCINGKWKAYRTSTDLRVLPRPNSSRS